MSVNLLMKYPVDAITERPVCYAVRPYQILLRVFQFALNTALQVTTFPGMEATLKNNYGNSQLMPHFMVQSETPSGRTTF